MDERPALSVAFVPGVTITKWTRIWAERHPHTPLIILPTDQPQQVSVIVEGIAQLSFVRLPIDSQGLHVIPLYRERAVAVAAKDHFIALADTLALADIARETRHSAGTKHHDRGPFDLVAAGVGVLVVPQSVARLQSRKDVVVRPITDAPETEIALVWRDIPDTDAMTELIAEFIGIVRGRTAQSSRAAVPQETPAKKGTPAKTKSAANGAASGASNGTAKDAKGAAKSGGASRRAGATHAANRKRAESRKKHSGR